MEPIRRVAFFGSPEFAVPTLDALASSRFRPILVVSQPPRPAGRGRHTEDTAVALRARAHGIEVSQPEKVKDPAFLDSFRALDVDVAVVVAFGQIFPRALLALPRLGCINLHASLLPRHRGAAPIQAAIAAGDPETGVDARCGWRRGSTPDRSCSRARLRSAPTRTRPRSPRVSPRSARS